VVTQVVVSQAVLNSIELVGRLVGWLVGLFVALLVGWFVDLVGWLVS
jgi:hypothetical protein